jgi:hydroxymethyl cephem carbamoyltransferase
VASLCDGRLEFSIAEEKASRLRRSEVTLAGFLQNLERLPALPDVFAVSGWHGFGDGYAGVGPATHWAARVFGEPMQWFHSTHEKSHLFASYALSPFEQGRPCYALVWEGLFGQFYRIDEAMRIRSYAPVLVGPGRRYAYLHHLAGSSPGQGDELGWEGRLEKMTALAGFGRRSSASPAESALLARLLDEQVTTKEQLDDRLGDKKDRLLADSPFIGCGVESQEFKDLARRCSDEIFRRFHDFAEQHLTEKLPLLIGGGCGLHHGWNSRWRESGLFADVFVPPCCDDSGSAIGTAAEAQHVLTGQAKIEWAVGAGEEFVDDWPKPAGWKESPLDLTVLAELLRAGHMVAWVQGRCEIGPRALGHRSLLAAPFEKAMAAGLNRLAEREVYHPISAVCLREDAPLHFEGNSDSPHALYSRRVQDPRLAAVAHVDGSARLQTITSRENSRLHALLEAFKAATGVGVLCNDALSFKGRGSINHMTHLMRFAAMKGIGVMAINDRLLVRISIARDHAAPAP